MPFTARNKLIALISVQVLWGAVLFMSIKPYGMGVSRDSVEYMFTGLNLAEGRGFISFADQPYVLWPPLYPSLLALIYLLGGQDMFISAHILQFITFVGLSYCISRLFLHIFMGNFWLSLAGNILAATGSGLTLIFQAVGSDYLHLLLVMISILLAMEYARNQRRKTMMLMAVVGALAMLQRYIGLAVIVMNGLVILIYTNGNPWTKLRSSLWAALSILPTAIWMWIVSSQAPSRFSPSSPLGNIYWFTISVLEWFVSPASMLAHPVRFQYALWVPWIALAGMALIGLLIGPRHKALNGNTVPVLIFGLVYGVVLIGSASITSFNRLDGRFIVPLYIPFIALIALTVAILLKRINPMGLPWKRRLAQFAGVTFLFALGGLTVMRSLDLVVQAYESTFIAGTTYNTREWNENTALRYWEDHQPRTAYIVFSNYNVGVAFHTWRPAYASPRRSINPDATEIFPLEGYQADLFAPGKESYLVWIEPNEYTHVYSIDELRQIVDIDVLFENKDGGVYRLRPRQ